MSLHHFMFSSPSSSPSHTNTQQEWPVAYDKKLLIAFCTYPYPPENRAVTSTGRWNAVATGLRRDRSIFVLLSGTFELALFELHYTLATVKVVNFCVLIEMHSLLMNSWAGSPNSSSLVCALHVASASIIDFKGMERFFWRYSLQAVFSIRPRLISKLASAHTLLSLTQYGRVRCDEAILCVYGEST